MTNRNNQTGLADDGIEAVLRRAAPRPAPPAEDEHAIREAVRAEWQAVVRERKRSSRTRYFALAASMLVAIAIAFTMLGSPRVDTPAVAQIDKSVGAIYLLGDRAELVELADIETVAAGQAIQTGDGAALGLVMTNGGSLRIDENTRVEFRNSETVYLQRGRLYFDSAGGETTLVIETDHGSVTHLGTRYMAASGDDALIVSVREGRVRVDGRYYDETAGAGVQLAFRGSARPVSVNLPAWGGAWSWAEAMAPGIDLSGRSADEFLQWVARETGFAIEYADADAERVAKEAMLRGSVETDPRTALRLRMMTTDLVYEFVPDRGAIVIRLGGSAAP
ncbi:MAG: FecR family protein [Woeseiaceae bacterium]|nr:FecR family protein [Woeseiaceae bacterium]